MTDSQHTRAEVQTVAVLGLGKVGSLVAELLQAAGFAVVPADARPQLAIPEAVGVDVSDEQAVRHLLEGVDAVVSCLPYSLNAPIARLAHDLGIHYLDLTEDRETSRAVQELAPSARAALVPHCGLAPGFICIVGSALLASVPNADRLRLRVGALPRTPNSALGYAFTWSASGVVNEYLNDCEVLRDGRRTTVPALGELEPIVLDGVPLEAFTTSGGLGTMCETYDGKVASLDYKSLRYPGHCSLMRFFLHELGMGASRAEAERILDAAYPPVRDDVVFLFAAAEGTSDGRRTREEFVRVYRSLDLEGTQRTAISWTTAAGVVGLLELLASGQLPLAGLIRQEEVPLEAFLSTTAGALLSQSQVALRA